jgi:hypothetical protein
MKAALLPVVAVLLVGCASSQPSGPRVVETDPDRTEALLGMVKKLEGRWAVMGPNGEEMVGSEFKVSSGGTVVREIMFPGHAHEMTNLYHMDGPDIVMTHYCAVGNQPRMRARAMEGNRLVFVFDDVTNYAGGNQHCMRDMTLEFKDDDNIVEHWRSFVGDKPVGGVTTIELTRMR